MESFRGFLEKSQVQTITLVFQEFQQNDISKLETIQKKKKNDIRKQARKLHLEERERRARKNASETLRNYEVFA